MTRPQGGGARSVCVSPFRCVQSSILGHLEALGLLGRGRCFVEFGAGRGKLSHWIHEALKTRDDPETRDHLESWDDLQLLLVERCSTRFKAQEISETPLEHQVPVLQAQVQTGPDPSALDWFGKINPHLNPKS